MSKDNLPIYMKPEDWVMAYEEKIPHWAESQEPSPLAKQLIKMLGKESDNKILEVGVGNGRDSIFFTKKGNNVSGIDIAQGAIDLASKNVESAGIEDKIDFRVGNAEALDFADLEFDGFYSVSVLHATDLNLSLKELSRVLRVGGKALIYLYEKTEDKGKEYWFMKHEDVENLLTKNNLNIDYKWNIVHTGHEGEKTTVMIFELTKTM